MGAGAPGPGLRRTRVSPPHQLEGGLAGHAGKARCGRRLLHQGLRDRVLPPGLPPDAGDPRPSRLPHPGFAGRRDRRSPRDVRPLHDHPHLRRWHQRDPAGPHRHLRPRHAAVVALVRSITHSRQRQRTHMDFSYSEEQEAVRELAGRIFSERVTHERLKDIETAAQDEGPIDRDLWHELAEAGLLGIALGEDVGGAGLDFVAACLVIEAAGRTAAYVPVVETMIYGALPIDRFGTDAQRKSWLRGVAEGETILTAAMAELVGEVIVPGGTEPATTATAQADGSWMLAGTKACVPAAPGADAVLGAA